MKSILKITVILTVIVLLSGACQNETDRKVQNIESFTRLYGYARWFHPSDEAQEIDWDKFAVLGIQKVENIKSKKVLKDTLFNLFSPIVQGLQLYEKDETPPITSETVFPNDTSLIFWQHYGMALNEGGINGYRSARINRTDSSSVYRWIWMGADVDYLKNKEIKASGYFKMEKIAENDSAFFFVEIDRGHQPDVIIKKTIVSKDWEKYELSVKVPGETKNLTYGWSIRGKMTVYADEFQLLANTNGKWAAVDTANQGFETVNRFEWHCEKSLYDTAVVNTGAFSGNYCMKSSYSGKLFEKQPKSGETIRKALGNDLFCVIPLVMQKRNTHTFPEAGKDGLYRLQSELSKVKLDPDPQVNLASVVIAWNILQHFFPYFDDIDTNWDTVLGQTIKDALSNKDNADFTVTLSKMIAQLQDGHGLVFGEKLYHLPIKTEWIENEIVITASNDPKVKRGDILKKIDGKSVMTELEKLEETISGSPQLKRYRALNILGSKYTSDSTKLILERDGKRIDCYLKSIDSGKSIFANRIINDPKKAILEIEPNIYYVNVYQYSDTCYIRSISELAEAKSIIWDYRDIGIAHFFLHLIDHPAISPWLNIPQAIYPDRENMTFHKFNWQIAPRHPKFKSRNIIIMDPSMVSTNETILDIIYHYRLATTVGEQSAGCNGMVNRMYLPCGYRVMWTGAKVLKHDGSQLYLKGYQPDYPVTKTIQAIKEGRDEYLEKALEIAREPKSL